MLEEAKNRIWRE